MILTFWGPVQGHGHPPDGLNLKYFPDTNRLQVEATHPVAERFQHYIERIEVRRNGGTPLQYYLRGQDSSGLVVKDIRIPAVLNDTLSVTVHCNAAGAVEGMIRLSPEAYYDAGAYFGSDDAGAGRRKTYRALDDFRYHRFHDRTWYDDVIIIVPPQEERPPQPHGIVDTPQRRQLQLEEEIRRKFHKNLEGTP